MGVAGCRFEVVMATLVGVMLRQQRLTIIIVTTTTSARRAISPWLARVLF